MRRFILCFGYKETARSSGSRQIGNVILFQIKDKFFLEGLHPSSYAQAVVADVAAVGFGGRYHLAVAAAI